MKKLLLGLGTIAAVVTPVISVVACGEKTSIDIVFPKEKGEHSFSIDAELVDGDADSLVDLILSVQKKEVETSPVKYKEIVGEIGSLTTKVMSGELRTKSDVMKVMESLLQKTINAAWSQALLTETINITFNKTGGENADEIIDTSIIKQDITKAYDGSEDSFKHLTESNLPQKSKVIKAAERTSAIEKVAKRVETLKTNKAVIAWAESLPTKTVDAAVMLKNPMGESITLGSSEADIERIYGPIFDMATTLM